MGRRRPARALQRGAGDAGAQDHRGPGLEVATPDEAREILRSRAATGSRSDAFARRRAVATAAGRDRPGSSRRAMDLGALDARSAAWAARLRSARRETRRPRRFRLSQRAGFLGADLWHLSRRSDAGPAFAETSRRASARPFSTSCARRRFWTGATTAPRSPDAAPVPAPVAKSWKACTSGGSTGRPKVIVDGRPAAFAEGMQFIGIPEHGKALAAGPLYHNAPFSASVFALWRGSTVVSAGPVRRGSLPGDDRARGLEWALMVPTMMHRIMRLPEETRRRLICRAGKWSRTPLRRWRRG